MNTASICEKLLQQALEKKSKRHNLAFDVANNQLPSALYHMTHIDNLPSILEHGLYAHGNEKQKRDISNKSVNNRRENRVEPFYGRSIHQYVPLYFNPRNAMLYKTQMDHGNKIVLLRVDSDVLQDENTLFTDANAAVTGINFYNNIKDLEHLNWNLIFSTSWNGYGDHVKRAMMAEALVYNHIGSDRIESIICSNLFVKKQLENKLALTNTNITTDKSLFF